MQELNEIREQEIERNLREKMKNFPRDKKAITYDKGFGYASYSFSGSYDDALVETLGRHPTDEEIVLLVDGGFSFFGYECKVRKETKTFSGRINID